MDVILFKASSASAADDIVEAVAAQELWSVDMGTTSKASSYSNFALVECTATRATNLLGSIPDNVDFEMHVHNISSFSHAACEEKLWYLRGMIQG
tara:strand:+ start:7865 stop:8149 length:285 start_codon:yes stop_codon:yes gene_type:complete